MDSELLARISPAHQRRLAWFEGHQGEVSGIPGELADGLLLVSKPKGIYKPNDLPYALSIRINLDSPYADGMEVPTPGGGWLLRYHQERANPSDRDTIFTNRGLMRCIADRIPVGVLRERAPAGRSSRYDVLGLAMPVRWSDGYFFFESLSPRATPVIDPVSDVLEATACAEVDEQAVGSSPLGGRLRCPPPHVQADRCPSRAVRVPRRTSRCLPEPLCNNRLRRSPSTGRRPPPPVPGTGLKCRYQRAAATSRYTYAVRSPALGPCP